MTAFTVESCGPMTSLQDAGRFGQQRFGVSRSGAMDRLALAQANTLVGNPAGAGAIEFALLGGTFRLAAGAARVALAGPARLSRGGTLLPHGTSVTVEAGEPVTVSAAPAGIFSYLAAAGGFAVAPDLGSVSLQGRAGIGGLRGRGLQAGDGLPLASGPAPVGPELSLPTLSLDPLAPIRVVLGPQDDFFDADAIAAFLRTAYTVSPEADRMGYRLAGPPIPHLRGFNIVSDGIVPGSVQVPGAGIPIVMMADCQTTGGYPKIATVISPDLRLVANRRAGEAVRFVAVTVVEAQAAARERAAAIAALPSSATPVRGGLPGVEELLALNLAGAAVNALAGPC